MRSFATRHSINMRASFGRSHRSMRRRMSVKGAIKKTRSINVDIHTLGSSEERRASNPALSPPSGQESTELPSPVEVAAAKTAPKAEPHEEGHPSGKISIQDDSKSPFCGFECIVIVIETFSRKKKLIESKMNCDRSFRISTIAILRTVCQKEDKSLCDKISQVGLWTYRLADEQFSIPIRTFSQSRKFK